MRLKTLAIAALTICVLVVPPASAYEPIQVGFLWHMHQPIYYPYENPLQIDAASRFSYSVVDIHNQRFGPYTSWPKDAVQAGLGLSHLGAQVSFTGSLIENLNALEAAGVNGGMWNNWDGGYDSARAWTTSLGNRRLDLVAFGYHHPLMALLDEEDLRMQIQLHKHVYGQTWAGGGYSAGMFPPETAFSTRMIPALVAEGIDWIMVDNIHFDRACVGYPHTTQSGLFAPNGADQINPDPAAGGGAWVQLNNLWAPSQVSAPFGYQPHYVQHVDPDTGAIAQMVAVPAARYEGNEDGRGGYGAFLYDQVMDQYIQYNTDPAHPMFVMLHHDGDNFGGGSESYYHSNFQNMVSWVSGDPDYDVSTVDDYLDRFPPAPGDVIHVENGSWAGADNGDPEFKKWLGDPDGGNWSPDRNSWAVLTAAKNRVFMAESIAPAASMNNVWLGTGSNTERAWHWLLCGQASDYWYWDGTEIWDSNVTRASNQAVSYANSVISGQPDNYAPTIFLPQREPYNPGGYEWGSSPEASDFEIWTFAYDVSGLQSVTLYWRVDNDGANPLSSIQNETYAGGAEVGAWSSIAMAATTLPNPPSGVLNASYRSQQYAAMITGQEDVLIDYYVGAIDNQGNVRNSDIQHVWVGQTSSGGGDRVVLDPNEPVAGENVTIYYDPAGGPLSGAAQVFLHYGFDNWSTVVSPDPPMTWNAVDELWTIAVLVQSDATQLDMVFQDGLETWDNNNGADWHFAVSGGQPPAWEMDGVLETSAAELAANNGMHLWADIDGDVLYIATDDAGEGYDHFIYVALTPGALTAANWAKSGQIAAWDAFLADENDNDYEAWFDVTGAAQAATGANGGVLEGTLDLAGEFGSLPNEVYLAVGVYGNSDGGSLRYQDQVPASVNNDGNIDAAEYLLVDLIALAGGIPGDIDGDGDVDLSDLAALLAAYGACTGDAAYNAGADLDESGCVDLSDLAGLLANYTG